MSMWTYLLEAWRTLLAAAALFLLGLILIWAPHLSPPKIVLPDFLRAPPAEQAKPAPVASQKVEAPAPVDPRCLAPGPQTVAVQPEGDAARWFSADDYPEDALRRNEQGLVAVRYRIGVQGTVDQCVVEISSGSKSLDIASCRVLYEHARFTPARDAQGCPVPSYGTRRIRWQLPEEPAFGR